MSQDTFNLCSPQLGYVEGIFVFHTKILSLCTQNWFTMLVPLFSLLLTSLLWALAASSVDVERCGKPWLPQV